METDNSISSFVTTNRSRSAAFEGPQFRWPALVEEAKRFDLNYLQHSQNYLPALRSWNNTHIAKLQRESAGSLISEELGTIDSRSLTLFDCGCGDGSMAQAVIERLSAIYKRRIRIVLVDQRAECISEAKFKLLCRFPTLEVASICGDLSEKRLERHVAKFGDGFVLALFSSIVHEIPHPERMALLARWLSECSAVVVTEIEGDHDETPDCSVEFQNSVFRFYFGARREIFESNCLNIYDQGLCWDSLIYPEFVRLVLRKPGLRDHHFNFADAAADFEALSRGPLGKRAFTSFSGLRAFSVFMRNPSSSANSG